MASLSQLFFFVLIKFIIIPFHLFRYVMGVSVETKKINFKFVQLALDDETLERLTISAKESGRSIRQEVSLRLQDHLFRFERIASVGMTQSVN